MSNASQTSYSATLIVIASLSPALQNREFLFTGPASIGRVSGNDIMLPDPEVSRSHARISQRDGNYYLEDDGSLNGTYLNNERLAANQPALLSTGAEVRFGSHLRLIFAGLGATLPAGSLHLAAPEPVASGLHLDDERRAVRYNGKLIEPPLSPIQYNLLAMLRRAPGRVFSRDELAAALWPEYDREGVSNEAIDAVVKRLRERLTTVAGEQPLLITVRGHGYRLNEDQPNRS